LFFAINNKISIKKNTPGPKTNSPKGGKKDQILTMIYSNKNNNSFLKSTNEVHVQELFHSNSAETSKTSKTRRIQTKKTHQALKTEKKGKT
jgi:hypothetical protein